MKSFVRVWIKKQSHTHLGWHEGEFYISVNFIQISDLEQMFAKVHNVFHVKPNASLKLLALIKNPSRHITHASPACHHSLSSNEHSSQHVVLHGSFASFVSCSEILCVWTISRVHYHSCVCWNALVVIACLIMILFICITTLMICGRQNDTVTHQQNNVYNFWQGTKNTNQKDLNVCHFIDSYLAVEHIEDTIEVLRKCSISAVVYIPSLL